MGDPLDSLPPPVAPSPPLPPLPPGTGPSPFVRRHHWVVRLAHWVNAVVLLGMIGSGLQIYSAYRHFGPRGAAYTFIVILGAISVLSGFAIYKPVQLSWLTSLFGGYELARYWHFVTVWIFVGFTLLHVALVLLVDPAS